MMKYSYFAILIGISILSCTPSPQPETANSPGTEIAPADSLEKKMITAKLILKEEKIEEFIKAAKGMIDSTLTEPGCLYYQLYQDPYDRSVFMFVEEYKNQAAVEAHFAAPYFSAFGNKIGDWMKQPAEIKIISVSGITFK